MGYAGIIIILRQEDRPADHYSSDGWGLPAQPLSMQAAKRQPGAGAGMGQSSDEEKGSLRRGAFSIYIEDGIYGCYNINTFWKPS
jgi:hypothetical protein